MAITLKKSWKHLTNFHVAFLSETVLKVLVQYELINANRAIDHELYPKPASPQHSHQFKIYKVEMLTI